MITRIKPDRASGSRPWIAPALVDLQVNGYAGVDFQRDGVTGAELLQAVRGLRADGCGACLLTLITDAWPRLIARLHHFRSLRAMSSELLETIAGWHVEGPFLSEKPGYCGAHDPAVMCDPTPRHMRELRAATGTDPVLVTLAPERPGALAAIRQAVSLGIRVSLGHTDAPASTLSEAVAAGAVAFTHLGNACPRELDRHDNILWRVMNLPGLHVSLIPDAIHVSPDLFKILHRALDPQRILYVTDAMSAAGAPPGRHPLGRLELEVGADQVVRFPGGTNFAGSALRPIEGIARAATMLGVSWREVWPRFSSIPARLMGGRAELEIGAPARLCVVEESDDLRCAQVSRSVGGP